MGVLTLGSSVDPPHVSQRDDTEVPNTYFRLGDYFRQIPDWCARSFVAVQHLLSKHHLK